MLQNNAEIDVCNRARASVTWAFVPLIDNRVPWACIQIRAGCQAEPSRSPLATCGVPELASGGTKATTRPCQSGGLCSHVRVCRSYLAGNEACRLHL